jgi:methyl-accepting chemotaxis protein
MLETLARIAVIVIGVSIGGAAVTLIVGLILGGRRLHREGPRFLANAVRPIAEELAPALDTNSENVARLLVEVDDLEQAVEQLVATVASLRDAMGGIETNLGRIADAADRLATFGESDGTKAALGRVDTVAAAVEELPNTLARVAAAANQLERSVKPLAEASHSMTSPLRALRRLGR